MTTVTLPTVDVSSFLDSAPGIDLADLVADAGLLTRTDRKYVLTADKFAELGLVLASTVGDVAVLQIDGQRTFGYRSLYLDTPDLAAYAGAGRRVRRRFKVRTRDYLDTGSRWIEVKTRGPRGATVKERVPLAGRLDPADGLAEADAAFVADRLRSNRIRHDAALLRPTLETRYDRMTLRLPGLGHRPPTRVTVDTDLTWIDPRDGTTVSRNDLVIVETKGSTAPSSFDRVLWHHGHRPAVMSKYGTGLAAFHPELPAYKWQRVLDRHLGRIEAITPTYDSSSKEP